jgi:hypothetical protein
MLEEPLVGPAAGDVERFVDGQGVLLWELPIA